MSNQDLERVLVIDDNPAIHEDFRQILGPESAEETDLDQAAATLFRRPAKSDGLPRYQVECVSQGREGLACIEEALRQHRPFTLAFVDMRMPPGWDGLETIEHLWKVQPDLPVVICTAFSDYSWEDMQRRLGQTDRLLILKKPFDSVEVRQLVYSLTARARIERETLTLKTAYQLKAAFLEAQVNASLDGILVVDQERKESFQNQRFIELFKIPRSIAEEHSDENRLRWVTDMTKDPEQFVNKIRHLYAHPDETGRDEIELKDGMILDRYSAPVVGVDGKYYGRIWTFRDITERKRTEEQLRVQATALEAAANAMVITDRTGTIQWVNPAFTALTGYAVEEAVGQNPRILKSGQQSDAFYQSLWQTITSGQVWHGELINRRKDGSLYTEELTIAPVRGADGQITRYIAIKQDITGRKQAEEALQLSEERFRELAENITDVFWVTDPKTAKVFYVSPVYEKLWGRTCQSVYDRPASFLEGIHPDDRKGMLEALERLAAQGTYQYEYRVVRPDGSMRWVLDRSFPIRNQQGEVVRCAGIVQDITERKRAEESLHESLQLLQTVVTNTPIVLYAFDRHGIITLAEGKNGVAGLGSKPEDYLGRSVLDLYRDQPETLANLRRALAGETFTVEQTFPGGATFELTHTALHNEAGEYAGTSGLSLDITERKRAEVALQQSEERFRNLAENTSDWIWESNEHGRYVYASPRILELLGYAPEEVLGKSPLDFMPPEEAARVSVLLASAFTAHAPFRDLENINRHKDGHLVVLETSGVPIIDATGAWRGYRGIDRDITGRKRAEEALRLSEERFRELAENITDVFWVTDPSMTKILYLSPAYETLWGRTRESAYEQPTSYLDGIHPDDRKGMLEALERFGANGTLEYQYRVVRPDGSIRWAFDRCFAIRNQQGEVVRCAGIVQDITGRKQAEESLQMLSSAVEQAKESIAIVELQPGTPLPTVIFVNPAFTEMTGYPVEEVIGKTPGVLDGPSTDPTLTSRINQDLERSGQFTGEVIYYRKDGAAFTVEMHVALIRIASEELAHAVVIMHDITERKRSEAERENLHKQLVEVSRRGGMAEIATNVLHNVGNVLNSVNISTNLLVENVKTSRVSSLARVVVLLQEHARDLGTFITQDARGKHLPAHLAQLSEHLLGEQAAIGSELDSLRRNIEHIKEIVAMQQSYATFGGVKEMINVVQLAEDSLRINEGALNRHRVEIIREFEPVPRLNVEKHKILQILVNLVRNAKHACQDSERADRRLTVRVAGGEGRVRVSVMDNGVGISPENLARIFNYGFTTRKDGHGFGLHSGALAAREMGGSLTVHSDGPGKGATFTLELPMPDAGGLT